MQACAPGLSLKLAVQRASEYHLDIVEDEASAMQVRLANRLTDRLSHFIEAAVANACRVPYRNVAVSVRSVVPPEANHSAVNGARGE